MDQEGRVRDNLKELLRVLRKGLILLPKPPLHLGGNFFQFGEASHYAALQQARFIPFHCFLSFFRFPNLDLRL
jgi:hypothetical protein